MIPYRWLYTLVALLPILVVVFAVVMGGYVLAEATGDRAGAYAISWVAIGTVMLLLVDLLLLVFALGIRALESSPAPRADEESGE